MMMSQARATPFHLAHQLLLKNQSHHSQICRLLTLSAVDSNHRTILIASLKGSKFPPRMTWVIKNHDLLVLGQRQRQCHSGPGKTNDKKTLRKDDISQNTRTESIHRPEGIRNRLGARDMKLFGKFFSEFIDKKLPFTTVFSSFMDGRKFENENESAFFSALSNRTKELIDTISRTAREKVLDILGATSASKSVVEIGIKNLAEADVFGDKLLGVIFHEDGLILTCSDVIKDVTRTGSSITVRLSNGRLFPAQVECIVPKSDLAIIRVNKSGLHEAKFPALRMGNSGQVRAGELVKAIGNPSKLLTSATVGIVNSVDRRGQEIGSPNKHLSYIQTKFAIQFGGCGGPLLNMEGEVIGLNVRMKKDAPRISIAVPSDHIKEFINNTFGSTKPGGEFSLFRHSRGLTLVSLTENILKEHPGNLFSKNGVYKGIFVQEVSPGSPAQSCGIEGGDVILSNLTTRTHSRPSKFSSHSSHSNRFNWLSSDGVGKNNFAFFIPPKSPTPTTTDFYRFIHLFLHE